MITNPFQTPVLIKKVPFYYFLLVLIIWVSLSAAFSDDIKDRFNQGKKKYLEQKYTEAFDIFQQLSEESSPHSYRDDAQFWMGCCLEQIPERQMDAFFAFGKVSNDFPQSPWADDALVHQIHLAEQFAGEGKSQFKSFIEEKWQSDIPDIKIQAALVLARLGKQMALNYLQAMKTDAIQQEKISQLLTKFKNDTAVIPEDTSRGELRMTYAAEKLKQQQKKMKKEENFLGLKSRRYEQYQSMLRTDDNWTKEELNDFALWYILDTDQFEEYRNLALDYDRQEWLRKFWMKKDPTPTTERNEIKEEFDRRILFTRSYFAQFWNNRFAKYLPDQHLRYGWEHAPWDARGELYIKYGEPDVRSVDGWHTEEWTYYRYNVDFIVKQFMTNIYGNAIAAGPMTRQMNSNFQDYNPYDHVSPLYQMFDEDYAIHRNWNNWLDQNFIYNPEIRYEYDYASDLLDGFQLVSQLRPGEDSIEIKLDYQIPLEEFEADDQKAEIIRPRTYQESFVIMDEDLRMIKKGETSRLLPLSTGGNKNLQQEVCINIGESQPEPQTYILYISIYDSLINKQGIYTQELFPPIKSFGL